MISVSGSFFLSLTFTLAYSINILPNPSFETWRDTIDYKGRKLLIPIGWITSELYNSNTAIRSDHARSGNYAICVKVPSTDGVVGGVGTFVEISGGDEYILSLYYDCPPDVLWYVAIAQFNRSDSIVEIIKKEPPPSAGYTLFTTSFRVHPDAVKLSEKESHYVSGNKS